MTFTLGAQSPEPAFAGLGLFLLAQVTWETSNSAQGHHKARASLGDKWEIAFTIQYGDSVFSPFA